MNNHSKQAAGEVAILNVGDGDTKLSFDPKNPAERIRAARIVRDMIRRGYALLVEVSPGEYQRATDFDESKCEYIIADFDPSADTQNDTPEKPNGNPQGNGQAQGQNDPQQSGAAQGEEGDAGGAPVERSRRNTRTRRVPAETTRTVAVARTAGG